MANELKISLGIFIIPFVVYFCVKFGTIAFYKAKQYIDSEKEKRNL